MSISRYDQYQNFSYPFEELMKAGEIREARAEKGNDALDHFNAFLANINPAPGHENFALETAGKYYNKALDLLNSGIKSDDPMFMHKARQLAYQAAADPDIKNIQNSRKYYDDVIQRSLPEVQAKAGIVNMPGVMDKHNNFIQNRRSYNNFGYYIGDYAGEVDQDLSKVAEEVNKSPQKYGAYEDPKLPGMYVIKEGNTVKKWRDSDTFKNTIMSGMTDWLNRPDATPARQRYFAEFGGDPNQLKSLWDDRATKFFVNQRENNQDYQFHNIPGYGEGKAPGEPVESLIDTPVTAQEWDYSNMRDAITKKVRTSTKGSTVSRGGNPSIEFSKTPDGPASRDFTRLKPSEKAVVDDLFSRSPKNLTEDQKWKWVDRQLKTASVMETRGVAATAVSKEERDAQTSYMKDNTPGYFTIDKDGEVVSLNDYLNTYGAKKPDIRVNGRYDSTTGFVDGIINKHPNDPEAKTKALQFSRPWYTTYEDKNGKRQALPVSMTLGDQQALVDLGIKGSDGRAQGMSADKYYYLKNLFSKAKRSGLLVSLNDNLLGLNLDGGVRYVGGKYQMHLNTPEGDKNIQGDTEEDLIRALFAK